MIEGEDRSNRGYVMNSAAIAMKLNAVSDLIRLPKQYGTLLLMCPTLWALFLASGGRPSAKHLAVFILGTFLMRSAGCAINDIADRNFDRHVERTKSRPLASGRLSVGEATAVFIVLSLFAFALVLMLNRLTVMLSFAGVVLATAYPFIKRFSNMPQVFLGMAFGWGAVMAWAAVKNSLGLTPFLVFLANIFWSTAYDTVYALMDKEDDLRIGVKSTAIFFGDYVFSAVTVLYVLFALTLGIVGWTMRLGIVYFIGVAAGLAASLFLVKGLKRELTRERAFKAFVANVYVGLLILASIYLDLNL